MPFATQLGLHASLVRSLVDEGYEQPTPIQNQAIPIILKGADLIGVAQTGTGKTAAFALPILHNFMEKTPRVGFQTRTLTGSIRCLVLTPTRELALQVAESFQTYGRHTTLKTVVVYGGVGIEPQKRQLAAGCNILVATPGRLLDLVGQGFINLKHIEVFVLDEADRMFDMGFVRDIRKVVALIPTERQTLLFSATMPPEIAKLAASILKSPERIQVTPNASAAETVSQLLFHVPQKQKTALLKHLVVERDVKRCIVFVRTKHQANRVAENLRKSGIDCEAFHSNKSQNARQRALGLFKEGKIRVLLATDIAARGLDINLIDVVVNYDLPEVPETYVHRIGRTGRAAQEGASWSFCSPEQAQLLRDIERTLKKKIPVEEIRQFQPEEDAPHDSSHQRHSRDGRSNPVSERKPAASARGKVRPSGAQRSRQDNPVPAHYPTKRAPSR